MMRMQLLSFTMVAFIVAATIATTTTTTTSPSHSPLLRRRHHYPPRRVAIPHHRNLILRNRSKGGDSSGSGSGAESYQSTYMGCLGYSDSELSESWSFSGDAPTCSWLHSSGGGGSSDGGGDNGDDDGSDGYDGSGGGENDDDDDSGNGGDNGDDDTDDDGDGDGNGDNDDDGSVYSDDEIVISNEDVYGGDSQYDPIEDFDIEVCETYENLWIWDLAFSCNGTDDNDSTNGCNCSFAEELVAKGLLGCDDAQYCPNNCTVCATCLDIMGCGADPFVPRAWRSLNALSALYVVAAAIALLLFGMAAHYSRKRWKADTELDRNLLDKEVTIDTGGEGQKSPSMTYIHGGVREWRPLPSDREYAEEQLQPTSTMSTASTGRSPNRKKARPFHDADVEREDKAESAEDEDTGQHSRLQGEDLCGLDSNFPTNDDDTATVPLMVDTSRLEEEDIMGVSPIQTREESSSSEDDDEFDDEYDDDEEEEEEEDDPVFEDFSPRSMNTEGGEEKMEDA